MTDTPDRSKSRLRVVREMCTVNAKTGSDWNDVLLATQPQHRVSGGIAATSGFVPSAVP
jgi:hypothetical protein